MVVEIKFVNDSQRVRIDKCATIIAIPKASKKPFTVTDMNSFSPDPNYSYVFSGELRLHADGSKIEYVLFEV